MSSSDEFIRRHPARAHLVYPGLEKVLFDLGRFNELVERYRRVLGTVPGQPRTALALATLYRRMDDPSMCRRTLEEALEHSPANPALTRELAALLQSEGEAPRAVDLLLGLDDPEEGDNGSVCAGCGYRTDKVIWYCPSCLAFDSFSG